LGLRAGLSADEMAPHLAAVELGEGRRKLVAMLVPYALEEWGIDGENVSPTTAICLLLARSVVGGLMTANAFGKLAAENQRRAAAKPAPATGAN